MTATKTRTKKPAKTAGKRTRTKTSELSPAEQAIAQKYPSHTLVAGSYLFPSHPDNPFPGKATVSIRCPGLDGAKCGAVRQLATSDLHHVNACSDCRKAQKKALRKARKQTA